MRRSFFTTVAIIILLCSFVSFSKPLAVIANTIFSEQSDSLKFQQIVTKIQQGDIDAYKDLGDCYRDGKGIKRSSMTAMAAYELYSLHRDKRLSDTDILNFFSPKDSIPILFFTLINNNVDFDDPDKYKGSTMIQLVLKMRQAVVNNDETGIKFALEQFEKCGNELGLFMAGAYYSSVDDEACVSKVKELAQNLPCLYANIGEMYYDRIGWDELSYIDSENMKVSASFFEKANAFGLLSQAQIHKLHAINAALNGDTAELDSMLVDWAVEDTVAVDTVEYYDFE